MLRCFLEKGGEDHQSLFEGRRRALEQIRARDYAAELRERGASPIHLVAAVLDGKRAYARVG